MSPTPSTRKATSTRRVKTPADRAQEQLDAAQRAVDRLTAKRNAAREEHHRLDDEHTDAVRRRDYLAIHPDLPNPTTATTTTTQEK